MAHSHEDDTVTLTIVHAKPWDGGDLQLFQLQEKLNAYVSFALDGELAEAYPALATKPLRLLIECLDMPDERTTHLLSLVREQVSFQGIDLQVHVGAAAVSAAAHG